MLPSWHAPCWPWPLHAIVCQGIVAHARIHIQQIGVHACRKSAINMGVALDRVASFSPVAHKRVRRRGQDARRLFLLYLNDETWLGQDGSQLADQVQLAQKKGLKIVLAHEVDPARGGCEFSTFFRSTCAADPCSLSPLRPRRAARLALRRPSHLIDSGLYSRIAVAMHPGQFRLVRRSTLTA